MYKSENVDLPCPFLKIEKSVLILEKGPGFIDLFVKFSIQNGRKNSTQFFSARPFLCVFYEIFIDVPKFHETSSALKNFWFRAWDGISE